MARRPLVRLFWPLAIWAVVFGWRTVACKPKAAGVKGERTKTSYHYPKPPPSATVPPGYTPVGTLGE